MKVKKLANPVDLNSSNHFIFNTTKIAIVDHSRAFLLGLKELIESAGCHVFIFSETENAIKEIPDLDVDVVIANSDFPQKDGCGFLQELRKIEKLHDVPILAITTRNDLQSLQNAVRQGADSIVNRSTLADTILGQLIIIKRLHSLQRHVTKISSTINTDSQPDRLKRQIGNCKHDLNNILAILLGKIDKLEKTFPQMTTDSSLVSIKKNLERVKNTITHLEQIQHDDGKTFSSDSQANNLQPCTSEIFLKKSG